MSIFSFVKSKVSILDVVLEYVKLKQLGGYWKGPCPLHQETDASFTVSPDKQIFYCFGCHAGGDVIAFIVVLPPMMGPLTLNGHFPLLLLTSTPNFLRDSKRDCIGRVLIDSSPSKVIQSSASAATLVNIRFASNNKQEFITTLLEKFNL